MSELAPVFPVSPENVLKKLKASELRSIEVNVVDFSWISNAQPIPDEEIIAEVFNNNKGWAEGFFKRRAELQIQVFRDPSDLNSVFIVSSRENSLVTILKSKKGDLRGQIEIIADNMFISEPALKNAIDIRSLLPKGSRTLHFSMTAFLIEPDQNGQKRSFFGYDPENNKVTFDPVTTAKDLTRMCHEAGHVWARYLGADTRTEEQRRALKRGYQVTKDVELRGWETVSKGVSEVLFSERVANIIGKIIAKKIKEKQVLSDEFSDLLSREWRVNQEAAYDEHFLTPLINNFPTLADKIKGYFASRLNRTKS